MKTIIESPKGRKVFDSHVEATKAVADWLARHLASETCAGITVTVHHDGENCDHEVEGT